jgi:hypothetical protein
MSGEFEIASFLAMTALKLGFRFVRSNEFGIASSFLLAMTAY